MAYQYFYRVKSVSSERLSCERAIKVCGTFIVREHVPSRRKEGNMSTVIGSSVNSSGVAGYSVNSSGVAGASSEGEGVYGYSDFGRGVFGYSLNSTGVSGYSNRRFAIYGQSVAGGFAGYFRGDVNVVGTLTKGGGGFKIDHPLDPANKYLSHSFVESPDMKNLYDGVALLDAQGESIVELPLWFEALNQEFRYQLTPIGAAGPNLYIAEEISDRRFKIAGGTPSMKVCWQVTGSRKDAWAQANPLIVEQEKPAPERDHYLHPEVHGHSQEQSIARLYHPDPEVVRRSMEEQRKEMGEG
jgi:hypothetical protein